MLIAGILLIVFGLVLGGWLKNSLVEPVFLRPPILYNPLSVLAFNLIWLGCLLGGIALIYSVYPLIAMCFIAFYIYLIIRQSINSTERARIKRILTIYDKVRLYRPEADDLDIFGETARLYFREVGFNEERISSTIEFLLKPIQANKPLILNDLIHGILRRVRPLSMNMDDSYFKKLIKRDGIIKDILARHAAKSNENTRRSELSEDQIKRVEAAGLHVQDLSIEQVIALESAENPEMYHWTAQQARWLSFNLLFFSLLELIWGKFVYAVALAGISLIIMYIIWRTQTNRAWRQFREASIRKYAEDKRKGLKKEFPDSR